MTRFIRTILPAIVMIFAAACIKNDIPYPTVELRITGVEGEGFTQGEIDLATRTITIRLDETTDIRNVRITKVSLDAVIHSISADKEELLAQVTTSEPLIGLFDMRSPRYITLSLYQDYEWIIRAEQQIERRFMVNGQIGATTFDIENRLAIANVGKHVDLKSLGVMELKLGPKDITTYSPTREELDGSSFETVRFVDITAHGRSERWTLRVDVTEEEVSLVQADAWTRVLWLYGEGLAGEEVGFSYRKTGSDAWTRIGSGDGVEVTGGSFKARVKVEPETSYQVKAFCGDKESAVYEVTTDIERQLPNGDLELWSQPKDPWLPYLSNDAGKAIDPFWGSGNNGATLLGPSFNLTTPVTSPLHSGTKGHYAAQLASNYVVLKLAAGNLFTGEFAGLRSLSHGIVNFGRPFTQRPTALRLWVKYTCGQINNANDIAGVPVGESISVGDYDQGSVYIALGTWTKEKYGYGKDRAELFGSDDCPVSIDTRAETTFFNPKGEDVIGYGARFFTEDVAEWTQITIPIDYTATNREPTHIIVVCSASRWGDYFTGSRNSVMWVDDIELIYD